MSLAHDGARAERLQMATALEAQGRRGEAIEALAPDAPGDAATATRLAYLLMDEQRPDEAVAVLRLHVDRPDAGLGPLSALSLALKLTGRLGEAVAVAERAARANPRSPIAQHNLAAALGDDERYEASLAATQRAFANGIDAAETWMVHARALQGLNRFDEAQAAFVESLRRKPSVAAATDLAQLTWMRSGDLAAASRVLLNLPQASGDPTWWVARARVHRWAGDAKGAVEILQEGVARTGGHPAVHAAAAMAAIASDPRRALAHAREAVARDPASTDARAALAQAHLASGEPQAALAAAEAMERLAPHAQDAIALKALAFRMLGDPRYAELYDYARLVRAFPIDAPQGWSSREAYLDDLAGALAGLHRLSVHPIGQSLRGGAQAQPSLRRAADPVIRAFFEAVDGPIRRYMEAAGPRLTPPWDGTARDYEITQAWTVRLAPGGRHVGHVHPMGWISSACHILVPAAVDKERQGWLAFGAPELELAPPLEAEHFVRPEPGVLVLFPSYMWHGTQPFDGDSPRLTVAFDAVPTTP